jgi:hypothetical protein
MVITIDLPPEVKAYIKAQAAREGLTLEDYVVALVQEGAERRDRIELLAEKSFDEILAPFRRNAQDSGMSDQELDDLFITARKEAASTRKGKARDDEKSPRRF